MRVSFTLGVGTDGSGTLTDRFFFGSSFFGSSFFSGAGVNGEGMAAGVVGAGEYPGGAGAMVP